MNKTVLANADCHNHVTDENVQLQDSLKAQGWILAGFGYDRDNCVHVPALLDRHKPDVVFVMPREDWDSGSPGCFDKRCSFIGIEALATYPAYVVQVVKDSPGKHDRRKAWCEEIKADAVVLYYHERAKLAVSPWLAQYPLIRTYHTIDRNKCETLAANQNRRRALVSGATNKDVYPIRSMAIANANTLGLETLPHPGYDKRKCMSDAYLGVLSSYKVHVATASRFGFALRKIVESVAMGCTPVTDLPSWDVLPEIDEALVRVPQGCTVRQLADAVARADREWDYQRAMAFARKAWDLYDWHAMGRRLDAAIMEVMQ